MSQEKLGILPFDSSFRDSDLMNFDTLTIRCREFVAEHGTSVCYRHITNLLPYRDKTPELLKDERTAALMLVTHLLTIDLAYSYLCEQMEQNLNGLDRSREENIFDGRYRVMVKYLKDLRATKDVFASHVQK